MTAAKSSSAAQRQRQITLLFFVIALYLCFALQSPTTLIIGALLLAFFNIRYSNPKPRDLFWVTLIYIACAPAMLALHHGLSPFFYFFVFLLSLAAARAIAQFEISEIQFALARSYIFFSTIIFAIYWTNRDLREPFEGIIQGSSQNGITSYLIVLQATLSIFHYLKHGSFPMVSAVYTLFIAVIGVGRGSIYAASLILSFSALFNLIGYMKQSQGKKIFIYLLILTLASYYASTNQEWIIEYLDSSTKALQGPNDSARIDILNEYLGNLNLLSFFTGQAFSGTLIGEHYDGNPHIAYIRTHAYMGILVAPILISPALIFFAKAPLRDRLFVFVFSLILLFRAMSEPILFPTLLDFCYFLPFFYLNKQKGFVAQSRRGEVIGWAHE